MHLSSLLGGLAVLSGVSLSYASSPIEPSNFNIASALEDLGVDVSRIPALKGIHGVQTRSTDKACAAAVRVASKIMKAHTLTLFD